MTIDYEKAWEDYAKKWQESYPGLTYIGDEWIGKAAGAANSLAEYEKLIEDKFIVPYIKAKDTVLEIGIGGGRTAALLLKYCQKLICADISNSMLNATKNRLEDSQVKYVKIDGITLNEIEKEVADVCFSYDTMVHLEPRDIFNYLTKIPEKLKGQKLCIFHHTNTLSNLGWQRFLKDWDKNLMGKRNGTAHSVMTDTIMEKFLSYLNYQIIHKDTNSVPRDCVWICQAPESN
ncbi:MAG: class I SAM-dependent methyltransferase [Trichodesmium sp. MAG_R02]|jgi:SAM-dependent methyltransferase|nr:class I SAM-dependent methyltransferase [Trichodesmium sp. MAG_R02]